MSDATNEDADVPHSQDDDVTKPTAKTPEKRQQELLDESLEETFPASDAPTPKHIT
ncbi:MAG: hypothetical protein INR64_05150 [Caulobacteraceae bacterium]|nr:hypothetical protein [Caulobacter sp.]